MPKEVGGNIGEINMMVPIQLWWNEWLNHGYIHLAAEKWNPPVMASIKTVNGIHTRNIQKELETYPSICMLQLTTTNIRKPYFLEQKLEPDMDQTPTNLGPALAFADQEV